MSDPTPDFSRMARRLAQALNLSDWDEQSDSELEHLLDNAEPAPVSESQHDKIVHQAQQLIHQWETMAMAKNSDDARSDFPMRQPVAAGSSSGPPSRGSRRSQDNRRGSGLAVVLAGIALLAMAVMMFQSSRDQGATQNAKTESVSPIEYLPKEALRPTAKSAPPTVVHVAVGSRIETQARERKRVMLPDGSALFLNENTRVEVKTDRRLLVRTGEVFVEVVPHHLIETKSPFVVETPQKSITALGTKFAVKATQADTDVLVTQGKVKVSGIEEPVTAGQVLTREERLPAPRASEALLWTKELMASVESPLIPKSEHAGGALVAIDPSGQEMSLTLRKQHIDVHIEDGFARTTIDQTYFNSSWSQMEGTFYFPLPADASLSRLAMYVGENLMEGGMAERDHARNVFEQIRYTRRDPALLEWVDGSTFKMRVFPLEARQEKRIIISYTQRLNSAYGKVHYRFPAGHSLELIRDWSTHILVKNHIGYQWASPSHQLKSKTVGEDLVLETAAQGVVDDQDLVIELEDDQETNPPGDFARFSGMVHEGQQYLMLRFRPDLKGELKRKPRNWVFLFESAGNRDSLLARVQIEVLETLLKNAEHADTFSILTAATRAKAWKENSVPATAQNVEAAVEYLNNVHLVGALDLGKSLTATKPFVEQAKDSAETYLVHLGAGVSVLGEKETDALLRRLPEGAKYVGIGVGKRWSQGFMKEAANRTGGHVTQINPDEEVGWRSFELLALLNSPRVLKVKVTSDGANPRFLQFSDTLAQGEELCAITRLGEKAERPKTVTITGQLAGKPYKKTIPVEKITKDAGYLPRTWAKLEIDRLVANGAEPHKQEIIALSKAMYVMSPFTSLLVLETEEMYKQFNVDRGRKDHWALYPCPPRIPIVYEPAGKQPVRQMVTSKQRAKTAEELLKTVLVRTLPTLVRANNGYNYVAQGANVLQVYTGAIAAPIRATQHWNYWAMEGRQMGNGDMTLSALSGLPQGNPGIVEFLDAKQTLRRDSFQSQFGNAWWDRDFDGTSNEFLGTVDGVTIWNRTASWNGPGMAAGGVPLNFEFGRPVITSKDGAAVNVNRPLEEYYEYSNRKFNRNEFGLNVEGIEPYGRDLGYLPTTRFGLNAVTFTTNPNFHGGMRGFEADPNGRFDGTALWDKALIQTPGRFILELPAVRPRVDFVSSYDVNLFADYVIPPSNDLNLAYRQLIAGEIPLSNATGWSLGRFGDLTALAPGLNTLSADVQALLESQGPAELAPKHGKIDPKAQAVIDKARQQGWEAITLPSGKNQKSLTIRCDGQGRYVYERTLSEGLKERVVCDGQSLLHLYEQLGLAGRRTVSRFHRAEIARLVPWLVPPAEDLAVGCDVKSVNEHTIAIVPISEDKAEKESASPTVYLLMVFRPDGQLQERQLVETKTNAPLVTVKYGLDGSVEVFNKDDKRISLATWQRKETEASELSPDLNDVVVLSLPHRSLESFLTPEQQQLANNSQFAALEEESALALLGSYHATGNLVHLTNLLNQRYFGKEDHRIGLYVLLASTYQTVGQGHPAQQLMQKHPSSMLAEYLSQHFQWANTGNHNQEFVISKQENSFIFRLAMARNLYARWSTGQAINDRSAMEIALERKQGLESIAKLQSPALGWMLLMTMQSKDTDTKGLADYIQAADQFATKPGLEVQARYQAAFWRSEFGQTEEAVKQLEALSKELLDAGILPPITEAARAGFVNHAGTKAWAAYLDELQAKFLKEGDRRAAIVLAVKAGQLKNDPFSERLMTAALKDLSPEKHPTASLLAVGQLMAQKRFAEAEGFLAPILKAKGWSHLPSLWRKASDLAAQQNQEALSVARFERAVHLEYETLPELVNLQKIRQDYSNLLSRMESLAAGEEAGRDLKQRAIRVADRWRVLDPDDTAACQSVARILRALGEKDLAWDYLITPLAERPNESAPWLALAQEMIRQNDVEWADRAYREAFTAESTNAQILWDHAQFLRQQNRQEDAQELLEKIVHGTWQPRFQQNKDQAQQLLNQMNPAKVAP